MTRPVRLGAVSYLNVRPLVYGLEADPDLLSLRFDVPSECARLLAAGEIDLGMVPSITYAGRPGDRIVPGVCIGSDGPVASVALFARKPLDRIRHVALDTSSRTSAVLLRILCRRRFGISCTFFPHAPDPAAMLAAADAALLIGDAALFLDPGAYGAEKIDLGQEWTAMTGLPFVWAFWAGRDGAVNEDVVGRLQSAAEDGVAHVEAIAADYCGGDPACQAVAVRYLRDNLTFRLGSREHAAIDTYYQEAVALGLIDSAPSLAFFSGPDRGRPRL